MKKSKIFNFICAGIIICGLSACSNKKDIENLKDNNRIHDMKNSNKNQEYSSNKKQYNKLQYNNEFKNGNKSDEIEFSRQKKSNKLGDENFKINSNSINHKENNEVIIINVKYNPVFSLLETKINNVKLVKSICIYLDGNKYKYDIKKDMKINNDKNIIIIKNINGQFKKGKIIITSMQEKEVNKEF